MQLKLSFAILAAVATAARTAAVGEPVLEVGFRNALAVWTHRCADNYRKARRCS